MKMRPLSEPFLAAYADEAGPALTVSVGAYQVEGLGIHLFERVAGDHSTILGLPLDSTARIFSPERQRS